MYLLCLLNTFPISAACVKRLFLKMKLLKTCLRSKLGQVKLDQLLRIKMDPPEEEFDNRIYKYLDELRKQNPKIRIKI